jgi:predicted PurR-regulated permease PerM
MPVPPRDLTRATLTLLVIGGLILCSLWVIRPFLPATIWATTIVVATWPLLLRIRAALWHSRTLAVAVTTLVILLVFVVPFWLAVATILRHAGQLTNLAQSAVAFRFPGVPAWLGNLPLLGPSIAAFWRGEIESTGLATLAPRLAPYAGRLTAWSVDLVGSFGLLIVQFLLTVVIAAAIQANGETAAQLVMRFGHRLAGSRGQQMVVLAGDAVRAVAIGVTVTALAETLIGGLGMALTGVPLAGVLTALMFVCCVAQAGPGIVLIPAVIWMYVFSSVGAATLLLAISIVAITVDNLLRPFLIRKEADLPMLLVLAGVIGGLAAFGIVGIFLGPAVLAVSYTLLLAWVAEDEAAPAKDSASPLLLSPEQPRSGQPLGTAQQADVSPGEH